jgi:RimJ/RimL family protein N-acetyltransferase
VTIRPLTQEDLDIMSSWSTFDDPLYRLFDWPRRLFLENGAWFAELMRDGTRVYYAVEDERGVLIGRISLRQMRGRESARLGIGFGTDFCGQGYGTETLRIFLRYYFLDLGFAKMVLDVSALNQRAIRCYERCGFERAGSHYQYIGREGDITFLQKRPYRHLRRFIQCRGRRSYMLAYDMVLERDLWLIRECAPEPLAT